MEPVSTIEGRAIPFGAKNVDTDVIIPAHWLKTITREGLGRGAFETVRGCVQQLFEELGGSHDRARALIERSEDMARALESITIRI